MSSRKLPTFFSNKFRIFYLISLIFLEFSFLQSDKCGSMIHFHSPIFRYPVWIAPFVEGAVFVVVVALFLSKSSIHQCVTSSIFSHCFHWFSLVLFFLNIMLFFYYYVSVRQLEIWDGNNTSIFFILQSYCSFQDFFFLLLFLLYIVEDFLFKSCDEFCLKFYGGVHWIYRLLCIVWILWLFSQYKS